MIEQILVMILEGLLGLAVAVISFAIGIVMGLGFTWLFTGRESWDVLE